MAYKGDKHELALIPVGTSKIYPAQSLEHAKRLRSSLSANIAQRLRTKSLTGKFSTRIVMHQGVEVSRGE